MITRLDDARCRALRCVHTQGHVAYRLAEERNIATLAPQESDVNGYYRRFHECVLVASFSVACCVSDTPKPQICDWVIES